MPDITMCEGYDCPIKTECFRHIAYPTKVGNQIIQSYFAEDPRDIVHSTTLDEVKVCTHWIPWCPDCKRQVYTMLKFGGEICNNCRKVLRLPVIIPKERYKEDK